MTTDCGPDPAFAASPSSQSSLSRPSGLQSGVGSGLRTEPDPARLSCWCGGWGHFYNNAKDPPELTYCGNCEDAKQKDEWAHLSPLEQDLVLARLGDYPGSEGCKRIAATYDSVHEALRQARSWFTQDDFAVLGDNEARVLCKLLNIMDAALALATGSGTAETSETSAQCEASQSGAAKTAQRQDAGSSDKERE